MSKRALYDAVVQEVEQDKAKINQPEIGYLDVINSSVTAELPQGLRLASPTDVFADYAVRDALLITSADDEDFAFVMSNKIIHTVQDKDAEGTITQPDLEAFVTALQVLTIWEQFDNAPDLYQLADSLNAKYKLRMPSLMGITRRLYEAREHFPFASTRRDSVQEIKDKAMADLNE